MTTSALCVRESVGSGDRARAGRRPHNGCMSPLMLFRLGRLCAMDGAVRASSFSTTSTSDSRSDSWQTSTSVRKARRT